MTHTLDRITIPELGKPYRGKVRDIYDRGNSLVMVTTDRISCYDRVLQQPIPHKGQVLNAVSNFWFEQTKDIIDNHLVEEPHPNVLITKKCKPIPVEVIVRGYLAGSLWRDYASGKRQKCGISLPDGLNENDSLPQPILTPTSKAKSGHDEDMTVQEIMDQGIVDKALWNQIEKVAFQLFERGQKVCQDKGLVLVDTKYEFGLDIDGNLTLIDEIHTPDSSRFWKIENAKQKEFKYPDKEFVRLWLKEQNFTGNGTPPDLTDTVIQQAKEGYLSVMKHLSDRSISASSQPIEKDILEKLKAKNIIKGGFVLVMAGSTSDETFVDKITSSLKKYSFEVAYCSAHKNTERTLEIVREYNASVEPIVAITVAGRSNALSGVMAANLRWPVIACPPFKDQSDYLVNIHSSLQMPSKTPAMTVIDPKNAAEAAERILRCAS